MLPELCEQVLKSCAHGLAESEHGLENGAYDDHKNERPPQLVQKYVVQPAAPCAGKMLLVVDSASNLAGPLPALRKILENREHRIRTPIVVLSQEAVHDIQPGSLGRAHHGNRSSEFCGEFENVERAASLGKSIRHIQKHECRQTQSDHRFCQYQLT